LLNKQQLQEEKGGHYYVLEEPALVKVAVAHKERM